MGVSVPDWRKFAGGVAGTADTGTVSTVASKHGGGTGGVGAHLTKDPTKEGAHGYGTKHEMTGYDDWLSAGAADPTRGFNAIPMKQPAGPTGPAPDFDLTQPGDYEQAWAQYGDQFFQPSMFSQQLPGMVSQLMGPSNAQGFYNQWQHTPIDTGAGLDPYYDRARTKTQEAIDRAFAARGGFGSSAATDTIADSMVGLGAEQANREADFLLKATGENRLGQTLGGTLARGADISNIAGLTGAGNLMSAGGQLDLQGLMGGMSAAQMAQAAREGRIGTGFERLFSMGGAAGGAIGQMLMDLLMQDDALLGAILGGGIAIPTEAGLQNDANREAAEGSIGAIASGVANVAGAGGPQGFNWWGGEDGGADGGAAARKAQPSNQFSWNPSWA